MIYSNSDVRRSDRLLEETLATKLLETGEYGVLSMYSEDTGVYGIPINYAWDGKEAIYLHCATEGQKLQYLDKNNIVSFCIVGATRVISDKFTSEYNSIILQCLAHRNLDKEERMNALSLILEKYSPQDKTIGMKYAEKSFHRTEMIRLDIKKWSGKSKSL
ncbi:MAG: pyridoxamine 5'-phosphate oxidase family protein [Marinifilaceae bacterium]